MWNKIYFNEEKKRLDGFPKRCDLEDVVFIVGNDIYTGYFNDHINYENPEDSEFGFYSLGSTGHYCNFFEAESVTSWCYKDELIGSVEGNL